MWREMLLRIIVFHSSRHKPSRFSVGLGKTLSKAASSATCKSFKLASGGFKQIRIRIKPGCHCSSSMNSLPITSVAEASASICNVWADGLEEVMAVLRELILQFPYVSMVRKQC